VVKTWSGNSSVAFSSQSRQFKVKLVNTNLLYHSNSYYPCGFFIFYFGNT
jgi:uncharacterized protein YukE